MLGWGVGVGGGLFHTQVRYQLYVWQLLSQLRNSCFYQNFKKTCPTKHPTDIMIYMVVLCKSVNTQSISVLKTTTDECFIVVLMHTWLFFFLFLHFKKTQQHTWTHFVSAKQEQCRWFMLKLFLFWSHCFRFQNLLSICFPCGTFYAYKTARFIWNLQVSFLCFVPQHRAFIKKQ